MDFFYRFSTEVRAKLDDEGKIVEDEIDDDTTITKSEELSNGRKFSILSVGLNIRNLKGKT